MDIFKCIFYSVTRRHLFLTLLSISFQNSTLIHHHLQPQSSSTPPIRPSPMAYIVFPLDSSHPRHGKYDHATSATGEECQMSNVEVGGWNTPQSPKCVHPLMVPQARAYYLPRPRYRREALYFFWLSEYG